MAVKRYDGSAWQTVAGLGAQGPAATSSSIATWVKTASGGETSLSGNDDSSQALSYTVGQELVFINGTLLKRGSDYTATNGTSITGLTALAANDVATVWTVNAFSVTNAISNNLVTTTGDIIYASAANTPARLGIGSTDQVLKVSGGVPVWGAAASGGLTLINTGGTTLTGASVSITSIPGTYKNLYIVALNYRPANDGATMRMQLNSQTGNVYIRGGGGAFGDSFWTFSYSSDNGTSNGIATMTIYGYAESTWKYSLGQSVANDPTTPANASWINNIGLTNITSAITSIQVYPDSGNFTSGTLYVYGVN